MTQRGASAEVVAEVAKSANQPIMMVALYLDSETVRATNAYRSIIYDGNTYTALGHLLDVAGIEETADLSITAATVRLSGVDQTMIATVLTNGYIDRRLVISKAFLAAANDSLIVNPVPIYDGRCDAPIIEEDPTAGTCTVSLSVSSHWIDFERRPGRHTSHDEQQIWFPGDTGLSRISQLNKPIKWGTA